jgi:hypothetical protein
VLLARKGRDTVGGAARAAEDIARQVGGGALAGACLKPWPLADLILPPVPPAACNQLPHQMLSPQAAREMLAPLLDAACARLAFVLRRSIDAAAERASRSGAGRELLQPYTVCAAPLGSYGPPVHCCRRPAARPPCAPHVPRAPPGPSPQAFHAALRAAHASFVSGLEAKARELLRHHLDAATSEFALSLMADAAWCGGGGSGGGGAAARLAEAAEEAGGCENVPPEEQEQEPVVRGRARGTAHGWPEPASGRPAPRGAAARAVIRAARAPLRRRRCCRRARRSGRRR